jgi:hypothetical protein
MRVNLQRKIKFKGGAKMHSTLQSITIKLRKLERKDLTLDQQNVVNAIKVIVETKKKVTGKNDKPVGIDISSIWRLCSGVKSLP